MVPSIQNLNARLLAKLLINKATYFVIINQPRRLHERIHNHRTGKRKAILLHLLTHPFGQIGCIRYLFMPLNMMLNELVTDKIPNIMVKIRTIGH